MEQIKLDPLFSRAIDSWQDKEGTHIQLYFGSDPRQLNNDRAPFHANVVLSIPKNRYKKLKDRIDRTISKNGGKENDKTKETRRLRRTRTSENTDSTSSSSSENKT